MTMSAKMLATHRMVDRRLKRELGMTLDMTNLYGATAFHLDELMAVRARHPQTC